MKVKYFIIMMLFVFTLTACAGTQSEEPVIEVPVVEDSVDDASTDKVHIVTTLFPQYDFAKAIGQDKVEVNLLLPPGVEAHSYEPTPQDIVSIQHADLFIYTGEGMEPWAHKTLEGINSDTLTVIDASQHVTLLTSDHDDHDEDGDHDEAEEDHDHGDFDPHIWTDPLNAVVMVDNILEGLIAVDPINEAFYIENAENYKRELMSLHEDLVAGLADVENRTIVYGGHFAFGYFANRYDLAYVSPYEGFSPDAEPTPQKIAEMIDLMTRLHAKTIFYEELLDPKVSRVIASETGAEMALLHGAHNVSKDELEQGVTYISIMRGNLERLVEGLNDK